MNTTVTHSQPDFVETIVAAATAAITGMQTAEQKKSHTLIVERPDYNLINMNLKNVGGRTLLRTSLSMAEHVAASDAGSIIIGETVGQVNSRQVHISNMPQYEGSDRSESHVAVVFETDAGTKSVKTITRHYIPKERFEKKLVTVGWNDETNLPKHIADFLLNGNKPA